MKSRSYVGVVHLCLKRRAPSRSGPPGRGVARGRSSARRLADDGVAAVKPRWRSSSKQPHGGQLGIAAQQLLDDRLDRDRAGWAAAWGLRSCRLAGPASWCSTRLTVLRASPNSRAICRIDEPACQRRMISLRVSSVMGTELRDQVVGQCRHTAGGAGPTGRSLAEAPSDHRVSSRPGPDGAARSPSGPGRPTRRPAAGPPGCPARLRRGS